MEEAFPTWRIDRKARFEFILHTSSHSYLSSPPFSSCYLFVCCLLPLFLDKWWSSGRDLVRYEGQRGLAEWPLGFGTYPHRNCQEGGCGLFLMYCFGRNIWTTEVICRFLTRFYHVLSFISGNLKLHHRKIIEANGWMSQFPCLNTGIWSYHMDSYGIISDLYRWNSCH